jgi:predicted transcriptional regulator
MTEKGLVVRKDAGPGHVYEPAAPAQKTKKQLVGDLLNRLFDGSVRDLVVQALGSKKVTPTELREIRNLLDQMDS